MAGKRKLYWDSCIFYEWLGKENVPREKSDGIGEVLASVEALEAIILTSSATHLEVLPQKMNEKDAAAESAYLSLFDAEKFFEYQIGTNVILLAREIRDYYYRAEVPAVPKSKGVAAKPRQAPKMMDLGDCIHLATAIIEKADEFHTRDAAANGGKIPLLTLYDWSGVPSVCGKYPLTITSPIAKQGTLDVDIKQPKPK
jgi:hypothetical protein